MTETVEKPARKGKRREQGEGSAYQMADGRWRAEVTIGWERTEAGSRRRVRRYAYGRTEAEAKLARRELLRRKDAGELPIGDRVKVAAWLDYWLDEIAVHKLRPKTVETYRTLIDNCLVPAIGDVRIGALQPEHVERMHAALRERDLSSSTRLQAHRILSRALKVAMQRGKVSRNVATLVDTPEQDRRAKHYLDADQARAVLAAAQGAWNEARWSVALALGLRQGEALGLLWEDVDLVASVVRVRRQLQRRRGGTLELVSVKTAAGERAIALPAQLHAALVAHREHQRVNRLELGPNYVGSELGDFVFATGFGRAIEPRADYAAWHQLLDAAGVERMPLHSARHTAATLMLLQGVDAKVVSVVLGHSSVTITRDLYQHVTPQLAHDAAAKVGSALWGK